jgi:hypothetical protein
MVWDGGDGRRGKQGGLRIHDKSHDSVLVAMDEISRMYSVRDICGSWLAWDKKKVRQFEVRPVTSRLTPCCGAAIPSDSEHSFLRAVQVVVATTAPDHQCQLDRRSTFLSYNIM